MDPQAARAPVLGAAEPPRGPPLPSAQEAPRSSGVGLAPGEHSGQGRETEKATDRLASGAQSIPNDSPTHGEGTHSEEEGFAMDEEDSDGEVNTWELSEGLSGCPPKEQAADLFNEDWDLELKADQGNPYDADDIQGCLSQEVKPWVCCAAQGDMIYDPSWHHPPPLIPHYSKMVFETGQFDDAED
ncbi:coordinator of PRMT5 and differentiation stimulator isoform X1 [Equus asinus]|uniref:UTP6 small subunit processome component n=2 Tax=Equus asinus TaxID=9793 RepID=A0A9L0III7_EQUAS|nr:coordinator of PRMT5 and differentiation stimulator isoform X2 [Equus asinus]XP_046532123.1 coordinator of PRMT5 and differentiation stimulator [Equus quagga]